MHFLSYLITGLVSIGCYEALKALDRRLRMKYRWKCPEANCAFKFSTTSKEGFNLVRKDHILMH